MVLKADQERVKTLLKDTITLLCRNGLSFQAKFCIDAVIGVTLDDSELFYMSMNEVIRSEKAVLREEEVEEQVSPSKRPSESRRKRHKRRRMKQEAQSGGEEEEEDSASQDSDSGAADNPSFMSQVKHEVGEASGEDSNDIVFIKQELDQSWPPDGDQSYYSGPSNTGEGDTAYRPASGDLDTSYSEHTDLSGVSLVPVGGTNTEASAVWSQGTPSYSGRGRGRGQMRTTSNTQQGEIQAGANQQDDEDASCVLAVQHYSQSSPTDDNDTSGVYPVHLLSHKDNDVFPALLPSTSPPEPPSDDHCVLAVRHYTKTTPGKGTVELAKDGNPYHCGICDRTFRSHNGYLVHKDKHKGIFPYKCSECGKGFTAKTSLDSHMRHHTGERLACDICGKEFIFKASLLNHTKTHIEFE